MRLYSEINFLLLFPPQTFWGNKNQNQLLHTEGPKSPCNLGTLQKNEQPGGAGDSQAAWPSGDTTNDRGGKELKQLQERTPSAKERTLHRRKDLRTVEISLQVMRTVDAVVLLEKNL